MNENPILEIVIYSSSSDKKCLMWTYPLFILIVRYCMKECKIKICKTSTPLREFIVSENVGVKSLVRFFKNGLARKFSIMHEPFYILFQPRQK